MRCHSQPLDLFHLESDIGVDHVITHDTTHLEKLTVHIQSFERLIESVGNRRDFLFFFRRQIVKILIHRTPGMNTVLDPVKTCQQHG